MSTLATLLREWRERAKLSQYELAVRARVHENHVGLIERGRRLPSADVVVRLLAALDCSDEEQRHAMALLATATVPSLLLDAFLEERREGDDALRRKRRPQAPQSSPTTRGGGAAALPRPAGGDGPITHTPREYGQPTIRPSARRRRTAGRAAAQRDSVEQAA